RTIAARATSATRIAATSPLSGPLRSTWLVWTWDRTSGSVSTMMSSWSTVSEAVFTAPAASASPVPAPICWAASHVPPPFAGRARDGRVDELDRRLEHDARQVHFSIEDRAPLLLAAAPAHGRFRPAGRRPRDREPARSRLARAGRRRHRIHC